MKVSALGIFLKVLLTEVEGELKGGVVCAALDRAA